MNRRNMLIMVALLLLGLSLACNPFGYVDPPEGVTQSSVNHSSQPRPPEPKLNVRNIGGIGENRFAIKAYAPGPPYPSYLHVWWKPSDSNRVESTQPSHSQYLAYKSVDGVAWDLPVDPNTGETPEVTIQYTAAGWTGANLVDTFGAQDDSRKTATSQAITRPPSGGGSQATQTGAPWVEAQPAQPSSAQDDTYYLWQVWEHFWPTSAMTMTASICQDQVDLLQSGNAFFALRFPVSPTLPYTAPYPLPLVTGPITYTPHLNLKYDSAPYTRGRSIRCICRW